MTSTDARGWLPSELSLPHRRCSNLMRLSLVLLTILAGGCKSVPVVAISVDGSGHESRKAVPKFSEEDLSRARSIVGEVAAYFGLSEVSLAGSSWPSGAPSYRPIALYGVTKGEPPDDKIAILVQERIDGSELCIAVNDFTDGHAPLLIHGVQSLLRERLSGAFPGRRIRVTRRQHFRFLLSP